MALLFFLGFISGAKPGLARPFAATPLLDKGSFNSVFFAEDGGCKAITDAIRVRYISLAAQTFLNRF